MTYVVTPDEPATKEQCEHQHCSNEAGAGVWTNQDPDGTVRSTIQWDLTDAKQVPKKAQRLCVDCVKALINGMLEALTPGGRA
jgi:hypothetical protein